jgi:WD40 repeat protein
MRYKKLSVLLSLAFVSGNVVAIGIDDMVSNQITNQISRQTSAGISKNLNDNLIIPQLNIRNASGLVSDFSFSHDEKLLAVLHQDKTVRVWDTQLGIQRPTILENNATKVLPLAKSNSVLVATTFGVIVRYDALTGKVLNQFTSGNDSVIAMSVSDNETSLLVAHKNGKIVLWNLETFAKTTEFNTDYAEKLKDIALSADGKQFVIHTEDGNIDLWNIDGKKNAELSKSSEQILAIAQDTNAVLLLDKEGGFQKIDLNSHAQIAEKKMPSDDVIITAAINAKTSNVALSTEKTIKLFKNSGELLKDIPVTEEIVQLAFINAGNQLLGTDKKGVIHLWQIASGLETLKLIATTTGWTVIDDKGRFDGSEAGMPNVSWDAADKNLPLDNFSEHHYEPGLLATHLANKPVFINAQPQPVQAGITLPPDVEITFPTGNLQAGQTVKIELKLTDAGGGILGQRLYHNGKIIDNKAMTDSKESEINGKLTRFVSYNVKLTAGTNKFKAAGINSMSIENPSVTQFLEVGGGTATAATSTLNVITVGINQYKDPMLNLNYSVADAKSIESMISEKKLHSFGKLSERRLLDDNATKAAIVETLKNAATNLGQNDTLALYLAGHGVAINGDWYFLPYETTLQEDWNAYKNFGISANEIQILLADIPAQKIIVMLDSCNSGASMEAFRNLQNTQRHFGRTISKSVGLVFLAATTKDQEAAELTDLGHGLFTYVVTNGMKGEADNAPKNQEVSAHELANFSAATIPTFSRKYLNASQEPTSFTIGDDFSLLHE